MIKYIRRRVFQNIQSNLHTASEIWDQHFDLNFGIKAARLADSVREMLCPTVIQVVAIDRRDHDIAQAHFAYRDGELGRLIRVECVRLAVRDIAKWTAPSANLTHNHKRSGAIAKTLAQIRARGLFADRR